MSNMVVPALFKVGVFAVIGRYNDDQELKVLVNVRTDQEKQRKAAGLPDDWGGKIVDLPGGTFQATDKTFQTCLKREVSEETGGCDSKLIGDFIGPFSLIKPETGSAEKPHDLALVAAVELLGDPQPNPEATEHRWVTWTQLEAEQDVRLPGKLGKTGRMANMIQAASVTFAARHVLRQSIDIP